MHWQSRLCLQYDKRDDKYGKYDKRDDKYDKRDDKYGKYGKEEPYKKKEYDDDKYGKVRLFGDGSLRLRKGCYCQIFQPSSPLLTTAAAQ